MQVRPVVSRLVGRRRLVVCPRGVCQSEGKCRLVVRRGECLSVVRRFLGELVLAARRFRVGCLLVARRSLRGGRRGMGLLRKWLRHSLFRRLRRGMGVGPGLLGMARGVGWLGWGSGGPGGLRRRCGGLGRRGGSGKG
ncbi:hypothetical protein GCM10011610_65600 [Nocardia rhizosphaerihabitans]|uniref:Uncharacterized protein n=1 Tax=Nocardia rhizosphaerihabitans TaxID=1691570 RepID=A0ABQ2L0P0_9NOCA|nr:hypothetical protein GCM10011610_65600 [Nocardia rhizosphaerihabitans]